VFEGKLLIVGYIGWGATKKFDTTTRKLLGNSHILAFDTARLFKQFLDNQGQVMKDC